MQTKECSTVPSTHMHKLQNISSCGICSRTIRSVFLFLCVHDKRQRIWLFRTVLTSYTTRLSQTGNQGLVAGNNPPGSPFFSERHYLVGRRLRLEHCSRLWLHHAHQSLSWHPKLCCLHGLEPYLVKSRFVVRTLVGEWPQQNFRCTVNCTRKCVHFPSGFTFWQTLCAQTSNNT